MKTLMYEIAQGRVFMGPQLLDVATAPKRAAVAQRGITVVVNLWWRRDDELADMVDDYFHAPMPDGRLRDTHLAQFDVFARIAARRLAQGGCVLTQCQGGRNRSGLLAGLTLCYWLGISGDEAVALVREGRGRAALVNPHFLSWLKSIPPHAA